MLSYESTRRIAHERVKRFHDEANAARHHRAPSRTFRANAARIARSFATWIEPDAAHPRGAHYASE